MNCLGCISSFQSVLTVVRMNAPSNQAFNFLNLTRANLLMMQSSRRFSLLQVALFGGVIITYFVSVGSSLVSPVRASYRIV